MTIKGSLLPSISIDGKFFKSRRKLAKNLRFFGGGEENGVKM